MFLLTADTHLDDQPANEPRWLVFQYIRSALAQYPVSRVFVLGDLVDRKDRHSAAFVNRLLGELKSLPIWILRGNHDTCLRPPAYFEFLDSYVSTPTQYSDDLMLLPFTPRPAEDWRGLRLSQYKAVFMHQTVTGAVVDHGVVLENPSFPLLPRRVKFYSGDIHHPQVVRSVTYVGSPAAIKFGDDYHCRMLLIDEDTFDIVHEIALSPPRKLMVDIGNVADLTKLNTRKGDQVWVRLAVNPSAVEHLGRAESEIAAWAEAHGVAVAGIEAEVGTVQHRTGLDTAQTPETILRQFAAKEKLTDEVLAVGLALLRDE
jgi:DNA repair exonuclease SbcCD nuclease subunit